MTIPNSPWAPAMKRLVEKGFITAQKESIFYPKISGKFVGQPRPECPQKGPLAITLETLPNSNKLHGNFYSAACNDLANENAILTGTEDANGQMNLMVGGLWLTTRGDYQENGTTATLAFSLWSGYSTSVKYEGRASGQQVEEKWFTYSFSPAMAQLFTTTEKGQMLKAGDIQVQEVTDLRLVMETMATSKFSWQSELNPVGATFVGCPDLEGNRLRRIQQKAGW